jgi:hypothetical protein
MSGAPGCRKTGTCGTGVNSGGGWAKLTAAACEAASTKVACAALAVQKSTAKLGSSTQSLNDASNIQLAV